MKDNELIKAIRLEIINQLQLAGLKNFEVVRDYQLTTQYVGASSHSNIKTRVFIHKISHSLINQAGYGLNGNYTHNFKSRIQVKVIHYFDYKDPGASTPDDICELISNSLFERDAIMNLRSSGIRLERRYGVNQGFSINEEQRFENMPSFDFIVTYQSNRKKQTTKVNNITNKINNI